MMKRNIKKYTKGQSLFEVVVAISISALIITGIVAYTSNSIQNSSYSRDKTLASIYVQEANEWLRQERDQNSQVFSTKATPESRYCLAGLDWNTVGFCGDRVIPDTKFTRDLYFPTCDTCPSGSVEVEVTVSWEDSKGDHEVTSLTDLSL